MPITCSKSTAFCVKLPGQAFNTYVHAGRWKKKPRQDQSQCHNAKYKVIKYLYNKIKQQSIAGRIILGVQ